MRVVLDANVVVSGIFWSGPPQQILKRWLEGKLKLLVDETILAEYRDVLRRMTGAQGVSLFAKWNRLLTELRMFRVLLDSRWATRYEGVKQEIIRP